MGAYSTRTLTRKEALDMIYDNLEEATNEELEEVVSMIKIRSNKARQQELLKIIYSNLEEISNTELEEVAFILMQNKILDNYTIKD